MHGRRAIGFDLGAETLKAAEVRVEHGRLVTGRTWLREHGKQPAAALRALLGEIGWESVGAAAATGRMASILRLPRLPMKAAVAEGLALLHAEFDACTVVSIGAHGFAVVDVLPGGVRRIRENSRCSQGTGNFLRQLVRRLDLSLDQADALCERVADPAPLSGRCPVILKTDLTHLANHGTDRGRILAGLYDAVCENVKALVRPADAAARLMLVGGVAASDRIRENFRRFAGAVGKTFVEGGADDRWLEAFGAARHAARHPGTVPAVDALFVAETRESFESLPPLREALARVRRLVAEPKRAATGAGVILGFDIGSTGSKAVAVDAATRRPVWEAYGATLGNPVHAAQQLARRFLAEAGPACRVLGAGVTGSGREIVGSLLRGCCGAERVFVINEIAAHAEGALAYDGEVDTIFEIGGQDAKYIRLDGGRICDAAMNEACSAGTGSFIEEQGKSFESVRDVAQMGACAVGADRGLSLGQHCSVFMAEVIDQAVAAGEPGESILAGVYDSVIQNYLNRVKGTRTVGRKIFCQGMPFMSDALAAAVARRTGRDVIVPPNPGTIGAFGIALLALRELPRSEAALPVEAFLEARIDGRDQFACTSTKGCGGGGNHCRIDRLRVSAAGDRRTFVWGGACSLYDRGARGRKLPDRAPDPFRERERLADALVESLRGPAGRPSVAITDEFALKGLFPFFATFLHELGLEVRAARRGTQADLKRGIQHANVPYCAPMQLYHGMVARMLESRPDWVFLPLVRDLPRVADEPHSTTCPIEQAGPGLIEQAFLRGTGGPRAMTPTIEMGRDGLRCERFRRACRGIASSVRARGRWEDAFERACAAQERFDAESVRLGREAVAFAREHDVPAVVVLGRGYSTFNDVLNSNVPHLLRELGAIAVPMECFEVGDGAPSFRRMFWHYGQAILRASHEVRRAAGVYGVFCSNYACGPDSFTLHFFRYVMENKPYAVIETDGHSGDAGTKTRLEAFLYCVETDRRASAPRACTDFAAIENDFDPLLEARRRGELLLLNRMGVGAEVLASILRGEGFRTEVLARPDRADLEAGRAHTSGKECVPMTITLGSVLRRLERDRRSGERFALLMPSANGPCRFGAYSVLYNLTLERLGWRDRVRVISPTDENYFAGLPADFSLRVWSGWVAGDVLLAALHDVRPAERERGGAQRVYDRFMAELLEVMARPSDGRMLRALRQATSRRGAIRGLVRRAAAEFGAMKDRSRSVPTVGVVGEIYVRLDPFANDFVIERLEAAGLRARLAPLHEWVEYATWMRKDRITTGRPVEGDHRIETWMSTALQGRVADALYGEMGRALGWAARTPVRKVVAAGSRYVSQDLHGEAILTVGSALHDYLSGEIDGVVNLGPLECMPGKIAESHFQRADADFGVPSVTLALNGDPVDPRLVEAFAFEVRERRHATRPEAALPKPRVSLGDVFWHASGRLVGAAMGWIPIPPPRPVVSAR